MRTNEIWKDIDGYEGLYQVSSLGNVKNVKRNCLLKPCIHKLGYASVMLYKNNKPKRYNIHRLVAMAFLDNVNHYDLVNHIDEDKANNRVDNLEWCSSEYNMRFGTISRRLSEKRGHKARNKRPVLQIDDIGNVVRAFESIAQAARETGTSRTSINQSCKNRRKKANNFYWSYSTREEMA